MVLLLLLLLLHVVDVVVLLHLLLVMVVGRDDRNGGLRIGRWRDGVRRGCGCHGVVDGEEDVGALVGWGCGGWLGRVALCVRQLLLRLLRLLLGEWRRLVRVVWRHWWHEGRWDQRWVVAI